MKKILILLISLTTLSSVKAINLNLTKFKHLSTFANPTLTVKVTRNGVEKNTRIMYLANGTESLNQGYDAGAPPINVTSFELYTHLVNNSVGVNFKLQVVSDSYNDKTAIPLSVLSPASSTLIFNIDINAEFPANRNVFIEDRLTKTITKISATDTYQVTVAEKLNGIGRFYLHTSELAWLGITNTDWDTDTNWSTGNVPIATDNVLITNTVNKPVASSDVSINNMAISAGSSLTVSGNLTVTSKLTINSDQDLFGSLIVKGTSSGIITYDRYLKANLDGASMWYLVGSPVVGQTIEDIITTDELAVSTNDANRRGLATYDNNQINGTFLGWVYQTTTSTGAMNSGEGFSIKRKYGQPFPFIASGKTAFTGTLKTDNLSSYTITEGTRNQWNLIANPYTSSIKANHTSNSFLSENIAQLDPDAAGLYVWDHTINDYKVINNIAPTANMNIAPGQGFFVSSKIGGGSVNILETMQTHQEGEVFSRSNTTIPHIKLTISDNDNIKSTDIKYLQQASKGLDIGYDAKMFDGVTNSLAIYTHLVTENTGINFMLQAVPNNAYEGLIIPIGINAEANKQITLSCKTLDLPADIMVFLEDRFTNSFIRLDQDNAEHSFTPTQNIEGVGRFYLHTSTNTLTVNSNLNLESVSIYKLNKSTVRIVGLNNEQTTFTLFNILGKQIKQTSFTANGVKDISLNNLSEGIYIVQLETKNGTTQKKIVLN